MSDDTDSLGEIARNWIKSAAAARHMTVSRLAVEAGAAQSSISRLFSGRSEVLAAETIHKLAAASDVPLPRQLQRLLDQKRNENKVSVMGNMSKVPAGEIDVWGVHPVQLDGEFRLNAVSPLQQFSRPPDIQASNKLMAFYAPDDTMAPRWNAGEPVFVDLGRPGSVGDVVLIRLTPSPQQPDDLETHLFRRYEGRRDGALLTSAFQIDGVQQTPLTRLLEVRRVLSWREFFA